MSYIKQWFGWLFRQYIKGQAEFRSVSWHSWNSLEKEFLPRRIGILAFKIKRSFSFGEHWQNQGLDAEPFIITTGINQLLLLLKARFLLIWMAVYPTAYFALALFNILSIMYATFTIVTSLEMYIFFLFLFLYPLPYIWRVMAVSDIWVTGWICTV